jgi:hypothetical protein
MTEVRKPAILFRCDPALSAVDNEACPDKARPNQEISHEILHSRPIARACREYL